MRLPLLPRRLVLAVALLTAALSAPSALADGNVTVELAGRRHLVLTGDAASNDVVVERLPGSNGEVVIRGRNGTFVNGEEQMILRRPRKLTVNLGDGDDVLALGAVRLDRRLRVDLGDGDDRCELFNVTVGRAKIFGGLGNDEIVANASTHFRGPLKIDTDLGDDVVLLQDCTINRRARVLTGDGDDSVTIQRAGVTHDAPVVVRTGSQDDTVHIQGCTFQNGVRVLTVLGQDSVTVMKCHFEKGLFLDTGEDEDAAHLEDASFDGAFKIFGGFSSSSGGATLVLINVTFGVSSDGDDKFFWRFVVINVF